MPSLPLVYDESKSGTAFVVAKWPDGDARCLSITQSQLARAQTKRRADSQGPLWADRNPRNHNNLSLCQRADRVLLLSIYEQSKQLVQFRVDRHGKLPYTPEQVNVVDNSQTAVVECAKFAIPICEMYVSGKCTTKKQLQQARDKMYKDLHIPKGYLKIARTKALREKLSADDAAQSQMKNQQRRGRPSGR